MEMSTSEFRSQVHLRAPGTNEVLEVAAADRCVVYPFMASLSAVELTPLVFLFTLFVFSWTDSFWLELHLSFTWLILPFS
jgi:hypothetical protein